MNTRKLTIAQFFVYAQIFSRFTNGLKTKSEVESPEPDFALPIENVTVAVGREAILSCVVENLAEYKVGWMKSDTQTILSLHNKVVTHNTRVTVTHDEPRTWNLHMRQVQESDRGCYMCQINTSSMKKTIGCIDVHVPPDIIDEKSSSDVKVNERGDVSLTCEATGYPEPSITWRREDNKEILLRTGRKKRLKVDALQGSTLNLTAVTKKHMGAYLCIAQNGVPPAVVKRIEVNVHFAPTIAAPEELVGAPIGSSIVLRCEAEASPKPISFWQKEGSKDIIMDSAKFNVTETRRSYKSVMTLVIKNLEESDLGLYLCITRNSLGTAEDQIRTYKIEVNTEPGVMVAPPRTPQPENHAYNNRHVESQKKLQGQTHSQASPSDVSTGNTENSKTNNQYLDNQIKTIFHLAPTLGKSSNKHPLLLLIVVLCYVVYALNL